MEETNRSKLENEKSYIEIWNLQSQALHCTAVAKKPMNKNQASTHKYKNHKAEHRRKALKSMRVKLFFGSRNL